jgi:hypothetical protein
MHLPLFSFTILTNTFISLHPSMTDTHANKHANLTRSPAFATNSNDTRHVYVDIPLDAYMINSSESIGEEEASDGLWSRCHSDSSRQRRGRL